MSFVTIQQHVLAWATKDLPGITRVRFDRDAERHIARHIIPSSSARIRRGFASSMTKTHSTGLRRVPINRRDGQCL